MMTLAEMVDFETRNLVLTSDEKSYAVAKVSQAVKTYCNITIIPDELNFTLAEMISELLHADSASQGLAGDEVPIGSMKSISIGDFSMSIGGGAADRSYSATTDELLIKYAIKLNKFRRMVWK
jgi:hypothetical protein